MTRPRTHAEINRYRRRKLIDATLKSLAEKGVAGTSVRTICGGEAGSRGLIGHYFKGKEELLAVSFEELLARLTRAIKAAQARCGDDPRARLLALPRAMFSPEVFNPVHRDALLAFWHEIRFNEAVRRTNQAMYSDYIEDVTRLLAAAAKKGRQRLDARSTALGLVALIDGLWLQMSINEESLTRNQAISLCIHYIDSHLAVEPSDTLAAEIDPVG